jgi:hypothetical protein
VPGIDVCGINLQRFVQIVDRACEIAFVLSSKSAIVESEKTARVKFDALRIVSQRAIRIAFSHAREPATYKSSRIAWTEFNGPREIVDRADKVAFVVFRNPAVIERVCIIRIQINRFVVISDGSVRISLVL